MIEGGSPRAVDPDSETTFTVKVKHLIEDRELELPVTAKLSAGEENVRPSGERVPAPASFTYNAPDEEDKSATVHIELRSKAVQMQKM